MTGGQWSPYAAAAAGHGHLSKLALGQLALEMKESDGDAAPAWALALCGSSAGGAHSPYQDAADAGYGHLPKLALRQLALEMNVRCAAAVQEAPTQPCVHPSCWRSRFVTVCFPHC